MAVAIEILLHTGMRLNQLAKLRLGEHLTWPDGPHGALHIYAPDRCSRDGAAQEYELVGAPRGLVREYIDRFATKPTRHHPHPPLFTNADRTPVTAAALADGIAKATLRGTGGRITPHQLRHFCAALILDTFPDDYTTVKDLLGHQFLESTLALYGGRQRYRAGAQWNTFINQAQAQPMFEQARHAKDA
jgi:integrase